MSAFKKMADIDTSSRLFPFLVLWRVVTRAPTEKEETIDGWIPGAFPVVRTTLSFNSAPKIMVELGLSLNVLSLKPA